METILNLLLIRFAVIAAVVVVGVLILFGIAVGLRRRGQWEQTRDRVVDKAAPMIKNLAGGGDQGRRGVPAASRPTSVAGDIGRAAIRYAADRVEARSGDRRSSTDRTRR